MRAFCQCGHAFTVHATQFPHQINCHVCGYKFLVQDDGRTHACEGPPREFDVACTCGQRFHIHAAHFPREVHCYACGMRFTVFDNGDVLSTDAPEANAALDPSAIQGDLRLIRPDVDAPVRLTDPTAVAKNDKAVADLKLVDLQWEIERTQYLGIARFVHSISSLRSFALGGLLALIVAAACLTSLYFIGVPLWVWTIVRVSWYLLGIVVLAFGYVVREVREFQKAESAWQTRRLVVLAKAGVPLEIMPAAAKSD